MADYNPIYELLVQGPDDAVGAFAYLLYKQHKVEFIKTILTTKNRAPTVDEMQQFHFQNSLPTQIKGYQRRADDLANGFLRAGLAKRIADIEAEVRSSALGASINNVQRTLDEKKTIKGWLAEVGANLTVNFLTILVIGALVIGYKHLSSMNSSVEQHVGLGEQEHRTPTQTTAATPTTAAPATPSAKNNASSTQNQAAPSPGGGK